MNPFITMAMPVLMLAAQASWAQTSNTSSTTSSTRAQCAAPATQAAMNACAYEDFLVASASYAERGRAITRQLSGKPRSLFVRSQSAWLAFRTATCDFESSTVLGGSAHRMVRWQCAARMTRARTLELAALGNCPEGEIACVRLGRGSTPAATDPRRP